MVAILQLKASKLIVYFVSFTVVIFTILNRLDNLKLRRNINKKNSSECDARLTLNTNTDSISMYKNERNHEIDVIKTAVRQVFFDIKSKSTSSESTKRIIAQVFGVYPNEIL